MFRRSNSKESLYLQRETNSKENTIILVYTTNMEIATTFKA